MNRLSKNQMINQKTNNFFRIQRLSKKQIEREFYLYWKNGWSYRDPKYKFDTENYKNFIEFFHRYLPYYLYNTKKHITQFLWETSNYIDGYQKPYDKKLYKKLFKSLKIKNIRLFKKNIWKKGEIQWN